MQAHPPRQGGASLLLMGKKTAAWWHMTIRFRLHSWRSGSNILTCWIQDHAGSRQVGPSNPYHTNRDIFSVPLFPVCFLVLGFLKKNDCRNNSVKISCVLPLLLPAAWVSWPQSSKARWMVWWYPTWQHARAGPQMIYGFLCKAMQTICLGAKHLILQFGMA